MSDDTINNDLTMGGAAATLLANRYRVVKQLGQGGMGSVWLAEDTTLNGRKVAIKMLPSILVNNKRAYAQVKTEALVSLKLSHSNVAAVRAFEEEKGNPFLVMDHIDGLTLDDYLAEKGRLTEEETIRLLKPIAAALDYAHAQGVVHRDVKPGNVMIRKDGVPFVLDFGIAREIQETMTRVTGKLSSGTLMYMSPEQLHGAAPKPAQDIYSFAAMAYECLTGRPPFSRGQIEYQIEHDMPEPLDPHFANCGPGVMAGLEKTPEARPATCAAVLLAEAQGKGSDMSTIKPRLAAVLLSALAVVALVGGGWWWMFESGRADMTQPVVTQPVVAQPVVAQVVVTQVVEKVVEKVIEKPAPAAVVTPDEETDEHRQEEVAKLATMRTEIATKVAAAKGDYAKVAPYRLEQEGFETHLKEIDSRWKTVEGVQDPKTLAEAEKTLAVVTAAVDVIAFELNWLETNRDGRDTAKRMEKAIADELEPKLREFKADDVAKSKYDKGQDERKAAAAALAGGEFASAQRQYEAAKATLAEALAEARKLHIRTALSVANEYKAAAQWQKCCDELTKVLGWEPENAEALMLKKEAERHLDPISKVKPCDYCGGTGRNVCRECGPIRDQAGKIVCDHGMSCSQCGGSGKRNSVFFVEPCSDCRGRGWERHSKCAGSGFLFGVCPKCKGTKMISAGSN